MNSYSNKILQEGQFKESCPNSPFKIETEISSSPTPNQIFPKILIPIPMSNNKNYHDHYHYQELFTVTKEILSKVVLVHDQNSTSTISTHDHSLQRSLHGIDDVLAALKSNNQSGISGDEKDLYLRHQAFGSNHPLGDQAKCLKAVLLVNAFKDTNILLLLCCAMLSLLIGIKRNGVQEGLLDGAIIFLAIFMVVNFGAIVKFYKARRNIMKKKVVLGVIRRGKVHHIPVSEIVVGDMVILKTGDRIPADGVYVDGDSFKLEDGSIHEGLDFSKNPSLFSGGKVVKGKCRMLVLSVGENTEKNKLMRLISNHQSGESKLQIGIDKMYNKLEKIWLFMSLLVLVVQFLRCFVLKSECDKDHNPDPKGVKNTVEEIMKEATKVMKKKGVRANGLVAMLCVLIFSIRDGLPLGILVLLAFASKKMKSHKATLLNLPACAITGLVTTGLVTTICTCKTGGLALQPMKMADLWVGLDRTTNELCNHEVLNWLSEAICLSTCDPPEEILLWWAIKIGLVSDMEELKLNFSILPNEGFDVNKEWKLVKRNGEGGNIVYVYWKGEPEMVLSMCSHYYHADGTMQTLDEQKRLALQEIIHSISYHSFAFAYKRVVIGEDKEEKETLKQIKNGLTWLGLVGFKNPYESRLKEAVKACAKLGKKIKLVVGDDIITAKLMGIYSGILKPEEEEQKGAVIEALEFRNHSDEDRSSMIDNVRVMANATPSDRLLMVQCLRRMGEVVAVTTTCTRDSPSQKEADVGIFLCDDDAQDEMKENGDIIISGSNSEALLCDILNLGRCVCNNLEKFMQLQLTLNIVAFSLNFILSVSTKEVPLSPFQLLWVNLIMDVFGALALAAQVVEPPPSETRPMVYGEGPVVTKAMWRNIGVQSLYQLTMLLILDLKGEIIFQVDEKGIKVMVFNCYVLCQVFELINAREIEKANVFEGILKHKNYWFLVIVGAIVVMQEVVIEIADAIAHTGRLDLKQWCICIGIAGVSMPIDWVAKWVFS